MDHPSVQESQQQKDLLKDKDLFLQKVVVKLKEKDS